MTTPTSRRRIARAFLAAAILYAVSLESPSSAEETAGSKKIAPDVVAIEPPTAEMSGRVLWKDGVTPVSDAEVTLTADLDGRTFMARSGRRGEFKIRAPIGQYKLRIGNRMELYDSSSQYQLSYGTKLAIDLLLLRNFERPPVPHSTGTGASKGPDPRPDAPAVVGTIVDLVPRSDGRAARRWMEAIAFLGSVLAVAVAAR